MDVHPSATTSFKGSDPMDGKINNRTFRKTVLVLLLFAGLSLMVAALASGFGPLMFDFFAPSAPPM
jgi:hypothetical protein